MSDGPQYFGARCNHCRGRLFDMGASRVLGLRCQDCGREYETNMTMLYMQNLPRNPHYRLPDGVLLVIAEERQ